MIEVREESHRELSADLHASTARVESCATCRAFNVLGQECRRKAPMAVAVQKPEGLGAMGIYPWTSKDGWCMEYLPERSVVQ